MGIIKGERKCRMIDREQIMDYIEGIQNMVDKIGYKGQNEYDLSLREEIADYIVSKLRDLKYFIEEEGI